MTKHMLTVATLGLAMGADAQIDVGGKAGLNYYFQSIALDDDAPSGTEEPPAMDGPGYHVGAFAEMGLGDVLYLRPELLYSVRSYSRSENSSITLDGTTTSSELDQKGALSYLEIPVLLGYRFGERFSLNAGPGLGALLGNKVTTTGSTSVSVGGQTTTSAVDSEITSTDGLSSIEVAGVVGLGYRMENGLDLGLRYWRGFTTLEEESDQVRTLQNLVQFSIGYAFIRD